MMVNEIQAESDGPPNKKNKKQPRNWSLWISLLALVLSLSSLGFSVFKFSFDQRQTQNAYISILGADRFFRDNDEKTVMDVTAFVTNEGTTSFAIQQVVWVLSQFKDPLSDNQRKIQWAYRPAEPLLIEGESVQLLSFGFARFDTTMNDDKFAGRIMMTRVPPELMRQANFRVVYWSSLKILLVDSEGDLHEIVVPAGQYGFGTAGGSFDDGPIVTGGDFRELPMKVRLLPSPEIDDSQELMRAWASAQYSNPSGRNQGFVDTTGWRFRSPFAKEAFEAWKDTCGFKLGPPKGKES